jgi:hypothetical protein
MDAKLRDRIIGRIEDSFRWAGASGFDEGMRQATRVLTFFLEGFEQMRTREELVQLLDSMPEPNFAQEKMILGVLGFLPQMIRAGAGKLAKKLEDEVPAPTGGRPPIPQQTRAEIVAFMGDLHTRGTSLGACKKRASAKFGYSESTVERMWLERGNIDEVDFRSSTRWLIDPLTSNE